MSNFPNVICATICLAMMIAECSANRTSAEDHVDGVKTNIINRANTLRALMSQAETVLEDDENSNLVENCSRRMVEELNSFDSRVDAIVTRENSTSNANQCRTYMDLFIKNENKKLDNLPYEIEEELMTVTDSYEEMKESADEALSNIENLEIQAHECEENCSGIIKSADDVWSNLDRLTRPLTGEDLSSEVKLLLDEEYAYFKNRIRNADSDIRTCLHNGSIYYAELLLPESDLVDSIFCDFIKPLPETTETAAT
ncbi:uncharacterized protein [Venturia canescens]|uniref:uncharacterized protein n=1 Tax=Venturia canescens TaxID=32260 RepID=UPI001C9BF1D6|nr:uncharacterized protein LOC122417956 [Venturia canescens]